MHAKELAFSHGTGQISLSLLHFGTIPALRTSGQRQESPPVAAAQAGDSLQPSKLKTYLTERLG